MSKQSSQHDFPEVDENDEDLDISPVSSAYSEEEEDAWFETHDDYDDDEVEEWDEPDYDDERPYDSWPDFDYDEWGY